MKTVNTQYILKSDEQEELDSWSYNTSTGIIEKKSEWRGTSLLFKIPQGIRYDSSKVPIFVPAPTVLGQVDVVMFDKDEKFIGTVSTTASSKEACILNKKAYYIGVNFQTSNFQTEYGYDYSLSRIWFYCGYPVNAIYKKLEKQYRHESDQLFFRETISGEIKLSGYDYEYINSASYEQNMLFVFLTNSIIRAKGIFNKTDCSFDYTKKSVSIKPTSFDRYTDLLSKYENTYDLIKLAPHIWPVCLTKRMAYQIYTKGGSSITTVANGIYWEDDVSESIDSHDDLEQKYYFKKNASFQEIHLSGFNGLINGTYTYRLENGNPIWRADTVYSESGAAGVGTSYISFDLYLSRGERVQREYKARGFTSNEEITITDELASGVYNVTRDIYAINLFHEDRITGVTHYFSSDGLYYIDEGTPESRLNPSLVDAYSLSALRPRVTPSPFYLSNNMIEQAIYVRIICDKYDQVTIGQNTYNLYDLPVDDFAYPRNNYKRCIGVSIADYSNFYQVRATSDKPTKFGRDDYGKYFTSNFISGSYLPVPINRSSWGNTAVWFRNNVVYWSSGYEAKYRSDFWLKDAYFIGHVIQAMLAKIAPGIKHELTGMYSNFLYGNGGLSNINRGVWISPKSNVLKSNYDQAAQKAEITFKQLMDMLRDCFRCYWYIDDNNNFIIQHISEFYNSEVVDISSKIDKFNKKNALYAQEEITFDKAELASRYEFSWADDSTELFGNNSIDIISQQVQKDKTEKISSDIFSSDIDLMLYAPDKFSSDGFALIVANRENARVDIHQLDSYFMDSEYYNPYTASVQNWFASWLCLTQTWYVYDMPALRAEWSGLNNQPVIVGQKRCMTHEVECFLSDSDIENRSLVKTNIGTGLIDQVEINLDTNLANVTIKYQPS